MVRLVPVVVAAWLVTGCSGDCTVAEDADGNVTITCPDGSTATLEDGGCTATDNGDGTQTIACDDGTNVTVADGDDGTNGTNGEDGDSCTIVDNGNGTSTISCEDGTSVTFVPGCDVDVLTFDTHYAALSTCPGDDEPALVVLTPRRLTEPLAGLDLGLYHTSVLRPEGRVFGWGLHPAVPGVGATWFQVEAAAYGTHGCALRKDGAAVCFGNDNFGETADNAGPFAFVSAGYSHSCGVAANGLTTCWGLSDYTAVPPASFVQVSSGQCGLTASGEAFCWMNGVLQPVQEGPFVQISSGGGDTCGLRADRTIECWDFGGISTTTPPSGPFERVVAGPDSHCALRDDGSIACWGGSTPLNSPPSGSFEQVGVGYNHACAMRSDFTVECWGSNNDGKATPTFPATCPAGDAAPPSGNTAGLAWTRYNGTWTAMPDFSLLTSVASGVTANVGIPAGVTGDNFGLVLTGWLNVPTTGMHDLTLTSDDGSIWKRAGAAPNAGIAVDHDGNHAASPKTAKVCLGQGWHPIRVEYYEAGGGESLSAQLDGAAIPTTSLVH